MSLWLVGQRGRPGLVRLGQRKVLLEELSQTSMQKVLAPIGDVCIVPLPDQRTTADSEKLPIV